MITVVSGIPRSGTSLMMQMLSAGGLPLLTDELRVPDANNPRGYCEWAPIKSLAQSPEVIHAAEGKVVKVISSLLPSLPNTHQYKIIFMCRPLEEVVASQNKMLERLGKTIAPAPTESVIGAFQRHLQQTRAWLANQPNMSVLYVTHLDALHNPRQVAGAVSCFLETDLDLAAMTSQVEQSLYRERASLQMS